MKSASVILLFFLLAFVLYGCQTQTPEIRTQTVRVEIPIQVPCRVKAVDEPIFAAAALKKADPLEVKVRALLAERRQRIGYEKQLKAGLTACQ
uniref:O-spanin n=3 Tax=unclassified bacterial viruses TaxID=12333 RepID=A0AAU6W2X4_9VIRU